MNPIPACYFTALFDLGQVCDAINKKIVSVLNAATEFATNGIQSATGIGIEFTDKQNISLPGFPGFIHEWFTSQLGELIKAFDLPDITIILPDFSPTSDFEITSPFDSALAEFGYLTDNFELDEFDPYPKCGNTKATFTPNSPICGNYKSFEEYQKAKDSWMYKFTESPEDLRREISKMPILNLNPVPINLTVPVLPSKPLLKWEKDILLTMHGNVYSFMQALANWGCLAKPDPTVLKQKVQELEVSQEDIKFIETFKTLFNSWSISGDAGVTFRFKNKDYATFEQYKQAVKLEFARYEKVKSGLVSFIIDMISNKDLSNFMKLANENELHTSDNAQACIQLGIAIESMIGNLSENMRLIKEYRDIPKQVFEIENLIYFYSDQVRKYVDVVLAEYLSFIDNNANQIRSWTETIKIIQKLIRDFNFIVDISANFVATCDDCRTDRTNAGLAFAIDKLLPKVQIPTIRFDVFSDVVLDLSEIEATTNIDIPWFSVSKQVIDLPEFRPVIIWPERPNLDFIASVKGLEVPLLPEPPTLDVELPPLPELNTFKLPVLPNPPDVKQLDLDLTGRLQAPMEFIQNLMTLICYIRKGLVPVPEATLGTKIESITNRPLSPVMPWDKALKITYPGLSGQYIEAYKYTLQTKLDIGLSQLVDLVKSPTDMWNQAVFDILGKWQGGVDEFEENVSREFEIMSGLDELGHLPDNQSLEEAIKQIPKDVQEIQDSLDQIAKVTRDHGYQKATSETISYQKLNQLAAQIPQSKKDQISNRLSDNYSDILAKLDDQIEKYNNHAQYSDYESRLIAGQKPSISKHKATKVISKSFKVAKQDIINVNRITPIETSANQETSIQVVDNQNQVQSIIKNKKQTSAYLKVNLDDTDNDNDTDVLYSSNNEFFLKENLLTHQAQNQQFQRPAIVDFEDSYQTNNLTDLQADQSSFSANAKSVSINPPTQLLENTLIVDVYSNSLESRNPYKRFVVGDQVEAKDNQSSISTENITIFRDDFATLTSIQAQPSNIQINLPLGVYSYDLSYIDGESIKVLERNNIFEVSVCSDRVPPNIILEPASTQLAYLGVHTFDLSKTHDTDSGLDRLFIDTDLNTDSNQDGIPDNDPDVEFALEQALKEFRMGPKDEFKTYPIKIWAFDKANNQAQKLVNYEVVTPKIILDQVNTEQLSRSIEPAAQDFPIEVIKNSGQSFESFANTQTDLNGEFSVQIGELLAEQNPDLTQDEIEEILTDSDQLPINITDLEIGDLFDISKTNGNVIPKVQDAAARVARVSSDTQSNRVELFYEDEYLTSIHKTGDTNLSVEITSDLEELVLTASTVSIVDLDPNDEFDVRPIGFNRELLRGGVGLFSNLKNQVNSKVADRTLLLLGPSGEIVVNDSDTQLRLEEISDLNQPQRVFISKNSKDIAAYFISTSNQTRYSPELDRFANPEALDQAGIGSDSQTQSDGIDGSNQADSNQNNQADKSIFDIFTGRSSDSDNNTDSDTEQSDGQTDKSTQQVQSLLQNIQDPNQEQQNLQTIFELLEESNPTDILDSFIDGLIENNNLSEASKPLLESFFPVENQNQNINQTPAFADVAPGTPGFETLQYLQSLGIIEGQKIGNQTFFFPNKLITRAEYAKIILKVLCITPREQSYLMPAVFSDIPLVAKSHGFMMKPKKPSYKDSSKVTRAKEIL